MSHQETGKSREVLIAETLAVARGIRQRLDPNVLQTAHDAALQQKPQEIRIDRERNIKFVMDFLNSPAGAHLKSKILT